MWSRMRRVAKRLLRTVPPPAPVPPPPVIADPPVGLYEAHVNGWYQYASGVLLPGFRIVPADTLVDVGCGGGAVCAFAGACGAEVVGVDIDPAAIEALNRAMAGNRARSFRSFVSDSNPLPLPAGFATKVVAQEVLEHVDEPRAVIAELARIGRPGAQYLVSVPDPLSEAINASVAPASYWAKPNHLRIFQPGELERLLTEAGLHVERRARYGFYWSVRWFLKWATDPNAPAAAEDPPALKHWENTWRALLLAPEGERVRKALDEALPKSTMFIARKAA